MAEAIGPPGPQHRRTEPPARSRNRRELFRERADRAQSPTGVLRALAGYIQAMFINHTLDEVKKIADRLADAADEERRIHSGEHQQPMGDAP
jgi:hypothetical protein